MLEGRWKMVILFQLFAHPLLRFSELETRRYQQSRRKMFDPAVLRELERDGIVERKGLSAGAAEGWSTSSPSGDARSVLRSMHCSNGQR